MTPAVKRLVEAAAAVLAVSPSTRDLASYDTVNIRVGEIRALRDAIAAARAELAAASEPTSDEWADALRRANIENAALRARVEKLEEAIRPFAVAPGWYGDRPDANFYGDRNDNEAVTLRNVLIGDLRRARAALTDKDEANG